MAPKPRKRVEAETKADSSNATNTLVRAKDGSAFARCENCNKNVAVALISMHNCSLDAKIRVNLEAQVVETQTEAAKKKPVERKKPSTSDEPKPKRLRKAAEKKGSTSNKPKRPLTAFFIFMNDFRKTFKEENPGSNVKDVAKQGGEKWKSLSEEEKKVYTDKAAELKAEYTKSLESNAADANDEEEEDEEKKAEDADDAEEKEADDEEKQSDDVEDADEAAEEVEVEKKDEGKEEEILNDY